MSISDHYTRALYRQENPPIRVVGLIIGVQSGLHLDIANSIEIRMENGKIDEQFARERIEAYKKMYDSLEVVGWYSADQANPNDEPLPEDEELTKTVISKFCENPLLMVFNGSSLGAQSKKKIPLFLYESRAQGKFSYLDFLLAASNAEQIAVDGIAHAVDSEAKVSALSQGMAAPLNAIKILRSKVNFLIKAVEQSEDVRRNNNFMRRLNQIVAMTPIASKADFDREFMQDYSET